MSETHKIYNTSDFGIQGYSLIFNDSELNKYDGCAIYVMDEFLISSRVLIEGNFKAVSITSQKNSKLIDVLATYRCFASSKVTFIDNLNMILQRSLVDQNRLYIFTGDINIDLLDTDSVDTNNYISMLQRHGLVSFVTKPTRKEGNSRSCLDHFFIKCKGSFFFKY